MNLRPLGNTGLQVSPIGLGTVKIGRTEGLKYPALKHNALPRLPTDTEALALLQTAFDLGINLIDTSPAYGTSEERLGQLLTKIAPRENWIICTKAGEEFESGTSRHDFSAPALTSSVERSLTRLRTGHLDIVLLHCSSTTDDAALIQHGEALAALATLKRAGKIRKIGLSTATTRGGELAIASGADVVMVTINLRERFGIETALLAHQHGVGVLVKKAIGSGHLDAAESIRFAAAQRGVSCVVVGTTSPTNLRRNTHSVT